MAQDVGDNAYAQVVQKFLSELINEVVNRKFGHQRNDIRAIVLAGGATLSGFRQVRRHGN